LKLILYDEFLIALLVYTKFCKTNCWSQIWYV